MVRFIVFAVALLFSVPAFATEAGWALLREGGQVVLLRHAYATGAADPAGATADDCSTQSRLSERGRQQARKMGALFSARAAHTDKVLSSRYCRALDTATLVFGASNVEPFAALDPSLDTDRAEIVETVRSWRGSGNLVLVTHLDVIRDLTGATPREGEALVVSPRDESLHVLARIVF